MPAKSNAGGRWFSTQAVRLDSRACRTGGFRQTRKGRELEGVMQAQLDLTRRGTNAGDLPEVAVLDVVVGVSVAGDVEDIEEVSAEAEHMLFLIQVKILEQRHIYLSITGRALAAVVGRTESIRGSESVSTGSIGRTVFAVLRRWIGTEPILKRTITDDQ